MLSEERADYSTAPTSSRIRTLSQELLLTPSEVEDTVSRNAKIPMKLHWVQTLIFHEKSRVFDFETMYLRAQMKLEGVLGLKVRLRELVGTVE